MLCLLVKPFMIDIDDGNVIEHAFLFTLSSALQNNGFLSGLIKLLNNFFLPACGMLRRVEHAL